MDAIPQPQPALQPPELVTWGGMLGSHNTSHPIIMMEDTDSEDEEGLGGNTSGQATSHPLPPEGARGLRPGRPGPGRPARLVQQPDV
jgi:hypothetical protein